MAQLQASIHLVGSWATDRAEPQLLHEAECARHAWGCTRAAIGDYEGAARAWETLAPPMHNHAERIAHDQMLALHAAL
eukprot:12828615-Prorocentrum_lima.AAC.1